MSAEYPDESLDIGGTSLGVTAEHTGVLLLREVIDVEVLPSHLRELFAYRPWPAHSLSQRIVDRLYIPEVPIVHSDAWLLEIIGDQQILVDGAHRTIYQGNTLRVLNLALLTRDKSLVSRDFLRLGLARRISNPEYIAPGQAHKYKVARQRLQQAMAPHQFFDQAELAPYGAYRVNPAMRIVDRREFK